MKKRYKKSFSNQAELCALVDAYFKSIEGGHQLEGSIKKTAVLCKSKKLTIRDAEPATIAGLVLHLGFNSREEFEALETKGLYSAILKRARLRIEAAYEKKLHQASPTAAMFVLKSMGWNEKRVVKKPAGSIPKNLTLKLIETAFKPVSNEKDVTL